jgi:transposase-like protein
MKDKSVERIEGLLVGRTVDGRSIYSVAGKRALIQACLAPGVSVAGSALANGVNANLLRKWIRLYQRNGRILPSRGRVAPDKPQAKLLPIQLTDLDTGKVSAMPMKPQPNPDAALIKASRSQMACGWMEIELGGAKLTLRGAIDARQLGIVLACLSREA